jgi:hypothetical protein
VTKPDDPLAARDASRAVNHQLSLDVAAISVHNFTDF